MLSQHDEEPIFFPRNSNWFFHVYVRIFWTLRQGSSPRSSSKHHRIVGGSQKYSHDHGPHCSENAWYLFQNAIFIYDFPVNTLPADIFKLIISIKFSSFTSQILLQQIQLSQEWENLTEVLQWHIQYLL